MSTYCCGASRAGTVLAATLGLVAACAPVHRLDGPAAVTALGALAARRHTRPILVENNAVSPPDESRIAPTSLLRFRLRDGGHSSWIRAAHLVIDPTGIAAIGTDANGGPKPERIPLQEVDRVVIKEYGPANHPIFPTTVDLVEEPVGNVFTPEAVRRSEVALLASGRVGLLSGGGRGALDIPLGEDRYVFLPIGFEVGYLGGGALVDLDAELDIHLPGDARLGLRPFNPIWLALPGQGAGYVTGVSLHLPF